MTALIEFSRPFQGHSFSLYWAKRRFSGLAAFFFGAAFVVSSIAGLIQGTKQLVDSTSFVAYLDTVEWFRINHSTEPAAAERRMGLTHLLAGQEPGEALFQQLSEREAGCAVHPTYPCLKVFNLWQEEICH